MTGTVLRVAVVVLAACIGLGTAGSAETPGAPKATADDMRRLIAAYPDHLDRIDGNDLVWKDGTRMPIDDGRGPKTFEAMLATADLKDMFAIPYPLGPTSAPPGPNVDPGRARNAAFFDKLYGDCRRGGVSPHLVEIVWLPRKWGRRIQVTRINGVAEKLERVSMALDALPPRFDPYLFPTAGTYNCRPIAGTTRLSAHGHGIAIDIALKQAHYWRWTRPDGAGRYPYRNAIPMEIVAIFEAHGFIWGGKWYHYDTMHFEYRPELIARD